VYIVIRGECWNFVYVSCWCAVCTKYLYIKSTTVYVPSLELGLPHPFSRKRLCPSPGPKGGGAHSPAAKGVGESQFQRLEKRLALCLLCGRMCSAKNQNISKSSGYTLCNLLWAIYNMHAKDFERKKDSASFSYNEQRIKMVY
jgi:hypothetical protein